MAVDATNIMVRVVCDSLPEDTQVVELEGREAISEMFEFRILITMPNAQGVDPKEVIGTQIAIVFESLPAGKKAVEVRRLFGFVTRCEDLLRSHSSRTYQLVVHPRVFMATLVETLDIQQDISWPDIVKKKLELLHLADGSDFEFRLNGTYPEREFTVQYKETDLGFINRLTEHLGISYFFEHRDKADVIVFTDQVSGFKPIEGDELTFWSQGERTGVYELVAQDQIVPSNFFQRDYNYRNPGADLLAQDSFDGFGGGIVEYGAHFKDPDEGKAMAVVRRQEKQCRARIYRGQAADPRVSAGMRVKITDHPYGDIEVLPFVVHHRVKQTALTTGDGGAESYACTFEAIDANLTFRPERRTPKPRIWGVVTGIVDSAGPGQYADIDEGGRYRVRFMFDTSGPDEGKASRPVRMMQPHSGGGYGMHFPLRRGVEVLITFLDGDPDRPIICGTVPNPQTPTPVASGNNTKNIIRTGGGNEIAIDDTAGSERVKIMVPHASTTFQLGAPNLAESGAAFQTLGAYTQSAASGTSVLTSFQASVSAWDAVRSSGNIVSTAEKPGKAKMLLLGLDLVKAGLALASGALATAKAIYDTWEKGALQDAVKEQDKATKIWEACNKCLEEQRAMAKELPAPHDGNAAGQIASAQAAQDAYADTLNTRRVRDASREATVGSWNDQNQIAHTHRATSLSTKYDNERDALNAPDGPRAQAAQARTDMATSIDTAVASGNYSPEEVAKLEAYKAKLEECKDACAGLDAAQRAADTELDAYHQLRQDNSDAHAFMGKTEKTLAAIAAGTNAASALVSIIMLAWSKLKKTSALAKLGMSWGKAGRSIKGGDARKKVAAPGTKGGEPIHAIQSKHSTHITADDDLLVDAPEVRVHGSGLKGRVDIAAGKMATMTSKNDMVLGAKDTMWIHAPTIDMRAQDHGNGKGKIKMTAKDEISLTTDEKDIKILVKHADKKLSLKAGTGGSDPLVTLQSHGAGTITAKTHDWQIKADKDGIEAGKKDKGEWKLDDGQALFKKKDTSIKLEDKKGTLTSEVWNIKGRDTKVDIFQKKVKVDAPGGTTIKSGKNHEVKCKKMIVNGSKIELG